MAVDFERIAVPQGPLAERLTELKAGQTNLTSSDLASLVPILLRSDPTVIIQSAQVGFVTNPEHPDEDPKLAIDIDNLHASKPVSANFDKVHILIGNSAEGIEAEKVEPVGGNMLTNKGLKAKLGGRKIEGQFQGVLRKMGIQEETRFHLGRVNGEPVLQVNQTIRR